MKKILMLLSAVLVLSLPVSAQNQDCHDQVICKSGKTVLLKCDKGYFMSVYDKGEKDYLTCWLGADRNDACRTVCNLRDWYRNSTCRDYTDKCFSRHGHHGASTGTCPVTFYHGTKHCYVSHGNGEYCRRYVSRHEEGKEYLLGRIDKKFLDRAVETLTQE